jgi:hypothetical protein
MLAIKTDFGLGRQIVAKQKISLLIVCEFSHQDSNKTRQFTAKRRANGVSKRGPLPARTWRKLDLATFRWHLIVGLLRRVRRATANMWGLVPATGFVFFIIGGFVRVFCLLIVSTQKIGFHQMLVVP